MTYFSLSEFLSKYFSYDDGLNIRESRAVPQPNDETEPGNLPESLEPSVGPFQASSTQEKSDDYRKIIMRIDDKWRVIECKDGIQWIIQKRKGYYKNKPAWKSISFCRSRKGLRYWVRNKTGKRSMAIAKELRKLPKWIES